MKNAFMHNLHNIFYCQLNRICKHDIGCIAKEKSRKKYTCKRLFNNYLNDLCCTITRTKNRLYNSD